MDKRLLLFCFPHFSTLKQQRQAITPVSAVFYLLIHIFHVLRYHHRNLKCQGILKYPDIKPGELLNLLQPVNKGITMNLKLPCCLGNIQIVFKELIYGGKRLLLKL